MYKLYDKLEMYKFETGDFEIDGLEKKILK